MTPGELERDLRDLAAATGWDTWVGVNGMLYAWRPKTSPPKIVRAATVEQLRAEIEGQS